MKWKIDKNGVNKKELRSYLIENNLKFKAAAEEDKYLYNDFVLFLIHPFINLLFLFGRKVLRKVRLITIDKHLSERKSGGNENGGIY